MRPQSHTIADEVAAGNEFRHRDLSNVGEIDYDKALIIADYAAGLGSPIILYCDPNPSPVVMYLKWCIEGRAAPPSWCQPHEWLDEFAAAMGLAGGSGLVQQCCNFPVLLWSRCTEPTGPLAPPDTLAWHIPAAMVAPSRHCPRRPWHPILRSYAMFVVECTLSAGKLARVRTMERRVHSWQRIDPGGPP